MGTSTVSLGCDEQSQTGEVGLRGRRRSEKERDEEDAAVPRDRIHGSCSAVYGLDSLAIAAVDSSRWCDPATRRDPALPVGLRGVRRVLVRNRLANRPGRRGGQGGRRQEAGLH